LAMRTSSSPIKLSVSLIFSVSLSFTRLSYNFVHDKRIYCYPSSAAPFEAKCLSMFTVLLPSTVDTCVTKSKHLSKLAILKAKFS
jgi:hypothetical protein